MFYSRTLQFLSRIKFYAAHHYDPRVFRSYYIPCDALPRVNFCYAMCACYPYRQSIYGNRRPQLAYLDVHISKLVSKLSLAPSSIIVIPISLNLALIIVVGIKRLNDTINMVWYCPLWVKFARFSPKGLILLRDLTPYMQTPNFFSYQYGALFVRPTHIKKKTKSKDQQKRKHEKSTCNDLIDRLANRCSCTFF